MSAAGAARKVVALLGATASGKTAAAIAIDRQLPVEVIAADSRQLRAEMRIGTAAPTEAELAAVPHHLIAIAPPDAEWSLPDFLREARVAIDDVLARGRLPLLIGGTGQYVWALLEGWCVPAVAPDRALRERLQAEAATDGGDALHERLAALDPASAERIDPRNVRRVIRALEIVQRTGAPVRPLPRRPPDFGWRAVGLRWSRDALHARADARVEAMYEAGLVAETSAVIGRYGATFSALDSIGYAEAKRVVTGEWTAAVAIERTKIETHRLIRMQARWFREDDDRITWVDGEDGDAIVAAVEAAAETPVR